MEDPGRFVEFNRRLRTAGDISVTAAEIAEARASLLQASPCDTCVSICEWIIQKAVGTGSCLAGDAALTGIFALADIVFWEADEILVPLEVVGEAAWTVVCEEVGIAVIGQKAGEYAREWCTTAGIC